MVDDNNISLASGKGYIGSYLYFQLEDNNELRKNLEKIGRDRIEKRFSLDYSNKPLLQAYNLN